MRLTEYLERTGEKQARFAKRAGLKQSTVNDICRGRGGVRADTAVKIIEATGEMVKLEDLLPPPPAEPEAERVA